jgi:hypothetical protein
MRKGAGEAGDVFLTGLTWFTGWGEGSFCPLKARNKDRKGEMRIPLISTNYLPGILRFAGGFWCIWLIFKRLSEFEIFLGKGDLGQRLS